MRAWFVAFIAMTPKTVAEAATAGYASKD
jgi:hypothetical protein